jgi:hypothetical protein
MDALREQERGGGKSLGLSRYDPFANGIDLSLLKHVSPIGRDNFALYGQHTSTGSSSAGALTGSNGWLPGLDAV